MLTILPTKRQTQGTPRHCCWRDRVLEHFAGHIESIWKISQWTQCFWNIICFVVGQLLQCGVSFGCFLYFCLLFLISYNRIQETYSSVTYWAQQSVWVWILKRKQQVHAAWEAEMMTCDVMHMWCCDADDKMRKDTPREREKDYSHWSSEILEKYLIKKTRVLLIMPMAVCRGQLLSEFGFNFALKES